MITTVDGVTKKRGDAAYIIAFGSQSGTYYPCVETIDDIFFNEQTFQYYHDKKLCQEQCDLMNKDLKK